MPEPPPLAADLRRQSRTVDHGIASAAFLVAAAASARLAATATSGPAVAAALGLAAVLGVGVVLNGLRMREVRRGGGRFERIVRAHAVTAASALLLWGGVLWLA